MSEQLIEPVITPATQRAYEVIVDACDAERSGEVPCPKDTYRVTIRARTGEVLFDGDVTGSYNEWLRYQMEWVVPH